MTNKLLTELLVGTSKYDSLIYVNGPSQVRAVKKIGFRIYLYGPSYPVSK